MPVDLTLADLDPAAPPPPLGSLLTLRASDSGSSWDVYAEGASAFLGRLPPDAAAPGPGATATVRSVRRAPDGGGLVAVVVRLSAAAVPAPPADDTGVRPVARRRGETRDERRRARKRLKHDASGSARARALLTPLSSSHRHRSRPARGRPRPGRPAVPLDKGGLRRAR